MMRHHSSRSLLRSKALLILACAAIALTVSAMIRETQRRKAVSGEIRAMQEEVTQLEQQRSRLGDLIRAAESSEFLEREARLRLGLQKPGETVLIIPEASGASDETSALESTPPSNAQKWWKHIFK